MPRGPHFRYHPMPGCVSFLQSSPMPECVLWQATVLQEEWWQCRFSLAKLFKMKPGLAQNFRSEVARWGRVRGRAVLPNGDFLFLELRRVPRGLDSRPTLQLIVFKDAGRMKEEVRRRMIDEVISS